MNSYIKHWENDAPSDLKIVSFDQKLGSGAGVWGEVEEWGISLD